MCNFLDVAGNWRFKISFWCLQRTVDDVPAFRYTFCIERNVKSRISLSSSCNIAGNLKSKIFLSLCKKKVFFLSSQENLHSKTVFVYSWKKDPKFPLVASITLDARNFLVTSFSAKRTRKFRILLCSKKKKSPKILSDVFSVWKIAQDFLGFDSRWRRRFTSRGKVRACTPSLSGTLCRGSCSYRHHRRALARFPPRSSFRLYSASTSRHRETDWAGRRYSALLSVDSAWCVTTPPPLVPFDPTERKGGRGGGGTNGRSRVISYRLPRMYTILLPPFIVLVSLSPLAKLFFYRCSLIKCIN